MVDHQHFDRLLALLQPQSQRLPDGEKEVGRRSGGKVGIWVCGFYSFSELPQGFEGPLGLRARPALSSPELRTQDCAKIPIRANRMRTIASRLVLGLSITIPSLLAQQDR